MLFNKMILEKKVRVRQGLWNEILPETNIYMAKEGYVILRRPPVYSLLKRYGQCVSGIDVKPSELPKRIRHIAEEIVKSY